MVCERFVGTGRLQEGGHLGTHKQDFEAHRKGCDWRHDATHIDMNPIISEFPGLNVQETLELISASVNGDLGLSDVLFTYNHAGISPIIMDGNFIHEVKNPVQPQDAATKWYVDQLVLSGNNWKAALVAGNFSDGIDVDINQNSRIINSDAGGGFTVSLTNNPIGSCLPFTFNGGDGYSGSDFLVLCGSGTTATGGSINMTAGNSPDVNGGTITLTSGSGGNLGGTINIISGSGYYTSGGNINITAGDSFNGIGGSVNIQAGSGGMSSPGIVLTAQLITANGDLNMNSNDITNCISCRAPTAGYNTIGAETTYHVYAPTSSNYLNTVVNSLLAFKDTYNHSIEYERNANISVYTDIPSNSLIKYVRSGKQMFITRAHNGTIPMQFETNYA